MIAVIVAIIIFIICSIVVLVIDELASRETYGSYVDDSILERFQINEETLRFNSYSNSSLSTKPCIAKHNAILSRYYIDGIGRVMRFSKTDKEIERLFKVCSDSTNPTKIVNY